MPADVPGPGPGVLYRETRERLTALVAQLQQTELCASVPACPGWTVSDVLGHLAAVAEDASAGRLTGVPSDEYTAAQVARFRDRPVSDALGAWQRAAAAFEEIIMAFRVWAAVIDVASHEQDIRGAVGRPGARDNAAIRHGADRLLAVLRPPVPLRIVLEDAEFRLGDGARPCAPGGVPLTLRTTRFEAFRWRMGRRSRAQLAALDWSADPAAVLDSLAVFGPADTDIIE